MPFVQSLARPFSSQISARKTALGLIAALALTPALSASAQGVPHLAVDQKAYHTLVPSGALITRAMCASTNAFCLAAVGQTLLNSGAGPTGAQGPTEVYAADPSGNIYVADDATEMLFKIAPAGAITILSGEYNVASTSYPAATGPAASTVLNSPSSLVADSSGDLYFVTGTAGTTVVMKIDAEGVAHRLTAPSALATSKPVEGALASSQYVVPSSLSLDAAGDIYITDQATCTLRVISAKYGTLNTKYGTLNAGCPYTPVTPGQKVSSLNIFGGPIALGPDGTIYYLSMSVYSVTTDGILHVVAACNGCAYLTDENPDQFYGERYYNEVVSPGPTATASIGFPIGNLVLDAAGNLYFASTVQPTDPEAQQPYTFSNYIIEVTKGSAALPSQVLVLASGEGYGPQNPVLNPEGMPSSLIELEQLPSFALDAFGRIILSTQDTAAGDNPQFAYGVAYLDRNGSGVFAQAPYYAVPDYELFTLSNSGTAPLQTVNIAGTGYPYYILPTAAELKAGNYSGNPPFTLDPAIGTCLPLTKKTGFLTLQPGESCTIALDYTANAGAPAAGSFTLYTNDPRGPLTIDLSASPIENIQVYSFFDYTSYNALNISATVLTPAATSSANGSFTIPAAVFSSVDTLSIESTVTPTGRIYAAVSNDATGAVTFAPVHTLDADGKTTFAFTGLAPGTYSLEAVYLGDGKSAPSFSTLQILTVTKPS